MKHLTILTAMLFSINCHAGELKLELHGKKLAGIPLMIKVYNSETQFPKGKENEAIRIVAASDSTILSISSLAPGKYAIAAFADSNRNGRLDRSFIGKPVEPYGFSNDARSLISTPNFASAAFELGQTTARLSIHLY